MSKLFTDAWKETLQNLSGKTIEGEFTQLVDLLDAFNATYSPSGEGITINNNGGEVLNVYLNGDKDDTLITSISDGGSYTLSNFETEEGLDYKFVFDSSVNASAEFSGTYKGSSYSNASCDIDGSNNIWEPTTYDYRWHFNEGDNGTLTITASSEPETDETLEIVNESSEDVEIYYEIDKEEQGNTIISAGSTETISIDTQYPYFIRYSEGGSDNRHNFAGTYQGVSGYDTEVYYYDGNICPPNEISNTEWSFQSGDSGTLLVRDAK